MTLLRSNVTPWPHQTAAVEFARGRSSVGLSMPMGTGKTLTCTMLLDQWKPRTVLVVATKKIATDPDIWPRHLQECVDPSYRIVVLSGETAQRRFQLYNPYPVESTAYLINFESVWRGALASKLLLHPPDVLLVDECHHAKSPSGTLSRYLTRLARKCKRRLLGTGTFLTHTPLDAWSQSRILDESVLGGSFFKFKARYAKMGGYMGKEVLSGRNGEPWLNQAELSAKLSKMWYLCERPELPFETSFVHRKFSLPDSTMKVYRSLEDDFVAALGDKTVSVPLAITRLMRLLQVCSGFVKTDSGPGYEGETRTLDDSRLELLVEVLQEIDPLERVVVFVGMFTHDLRSVERAAMMAGRPYMEVSGRANELADWKGTLGAVLGVHPKAGGEGLDFTHSRYAVMYSHQHSLGVHEQTVARVIRPPGKNANKEDTRFVMYLTSRGTVEDDVVSGLRDRKEVIQYLYDRMHRQDLQ